MYDHCVPARSLSTPARLAAAAVLGIAGLLSIARGWHASARAPLSLPAPAKSSDAEASESRQTQTRTTGQLNINAASQAEIELLPGVGPSLAARIIEHRRKNGDFHSLTDLDRVKGIGPKLLEKIAPLIIFEARAQAPGSPGAASSDPAALPSGNP